MLRRVLFVFAFGLPGCFSYDQCNIETCPPPAAVDACDGTCVPYVGGGWAPVLIPASAARAHCPEAAPFEAMSSSTVTVCGVQSAPGECSSQAYQCLPDAPAWQACIVRDGAHPCPSPYPVDVAIPDASATLCCPREAPPA